MAQILALFPWCMSNGKETLRTRDPVGSFIYSTIDDSCDDSHHDDRWKFLYLQRRITAPWDR